MSRTNLRIIALSLSVLSVGLGIAYAGFVLFSKPTLKACTLEARICPDGSSVGRTGPNCEFSPCPTPK